ncbi:SIR2 family protein [Microcella sp.]|uniref:SIR2 family protein n=1 Tax=Microcella sp. TaxID=1913979 RepID=UPI002562DF3E|nr:SIR2 family protein [Microcella sp.]MBX9470371.1 SIR2 family protein [Microcella sp.]
MSIEPIKTVAAAIQRLTSSFSDFASAFNGGEYVFWLGSGISRDRVPPLAALVERVLEYLRSNAAEEPEVGEHRTALKEVLQLAGLTAEEFEGIDYSVPVKDWPHRERILMALSSKYSQVLDVPVGGARPEDYLVWSVLDVATTYGSPDLEPDVEHHCIAILMLEGLVESSVTANWDGLVERALGELSPAIDSLARVIVKPDDFRISGTRIDLIKFHGCAVRARNSEDEYRNLIVARESQISRWTQQPENQSIRKHLESLYTDRPAVILGLSAQDANLHTVFAQAIQDLARPWPSSPPAVVLAEEELHPYHRNLLRITYGPNHQENLEGIRQSALLGVYAKPTLLALVLLALRHKLSFLMEREIVSVWGAPDAEHLHDGLLALQDRVASYADLESSGEFDPSATTDLQRKFVVRLEDVANLALTVFRTGRAPSSGGPLYEPLSDRPISRAVLNADFPARQFARLGVALALIGRGLELGHWSAVPGTSGLPADGVLRLITSDRSVRVNIVKDASTLTELELSGLYEDGDQDDLLVVADALPQAQTRSPKSTYGRTGNAGAGKFSVARGIEETDSIGELFEAFMLAGGF